MIDALSPLDGRYAAHTAALRASCSEEALIRMRVLVEIRYFQALAADPQITDLPALSVKQHKALEKIIEQFDAKEAAKVKAIEKKTNHDVKAVEYYLKKELAAIAGLKKHTEFVHFGLTSEDVNNISYGLMVHSALKSVILPDIRKVQGMFSSLSKRWKAVTMLSFTHGQPATPTTLGKEMAVFADRLERQITMLKAFRMQGKFGGAVATYSAHRAAYPEVRWEAFGKKFVRSLGLTPLEHATQINPHDDLAELSHLLFRINTILLDASRDMWSYISRGVFGQKIIAGEVGSSTMPHKVNPIDFENAEGNLGLSNALFAHFAEKLPISRLQRDLSDSTVQRNIGSAFGYHTLAVASLCKGLGKITLNTSAVRRELRMHPEVLAEPIQMVLRKNGVEGAYEKLKALTRGETVTVEQILAFVEDLRIPESEKKRLRTMCTL
ncbi:adenylosuccinate lyase [Candidatus Peregrinibacteria bacterium CG10_big_fil_rev_8_21_14_0_10_49_24]|nr:MAG: adenylosuccinate lyase [Candidatus Peregrinibacteria bacterium CG11_big_fil_rev_8_21_14_0_20_49_14]PIR50917.1 MAG: adenylosuccinate lyase [Candidatus Peregrinibacteria bacterium CG10_big_fil_rev_8_21_14_0_10_49_24]PJA67342.1 MAG: adenylosuccinate lyase [Candidatus Peregrinibacteria bacterium CG_4_9_14_3_um_filter_49_12]